METVIVIGLGEVGRPLYEILRSSESFDVYGYDLREDISPHGLGELPRGPDFLHICYPYTEEFIDTVLEYVRILRPKALLIHSTVLPGTTRSIHMKAGIPTGYSPVRGRHPNLKRDMMLWPKWVSSYPLESTQLFAGHSAKAGFKVRVASSPEALELAKLFETAYRAVMIAAWHEIHRLSRTFNASLEEIANFIAEVHEVLGDRPVYYPDHIGGHCLIPNTELLDKIDPESIWGFVLRSNMRRMEELNDDGVKRDVEALRKLCRRLTPSWYLE
jgi:UDP-N-acetyl-D-mannosaminuronate dehydrogenase